MGRDATRLAIYLDTDLIPAWQYFLVELLLSSELVSLTTIIYCRPDGSAKAVPEPFLLNETIRQLERLQGPIAHEACERKDVRQLVSDIKAIELSSTSAASTSLGPVLEEVRAESLDVILVLSELEFNEALSDIPRLGVWYFSHTVDSAEAASSRVVGLLEVLRGNGSVRSALTICPAKGCDHLRAYETFSSVQRDSFLLSRSEHLWKLPFFVTRFLERVQSVGFERSLSEFSKRKVASSTSRVESIPRLRGLRLAIALLRYISWYLGFRIDRKLFLKKWILMIDSSADSRQWSKFKAVTPPAGRFWADPFVIARGDSRFVFFEDGSLSTWKGHLSVMEIHGDGTHAPPREIIIKPYHLSYPYVFDWKGDLYLVPESAENRTIELYRCRAFPYEWEYVRDLMGDILAYDATLLEHDGLWWMFANVKQHVGSSSWDELCLFYADTPISADWKQHPMNPIVSDVRCARPAGRIFVDEGRLIRPSQDSSYCYGYGLNFMEITSLTTESYAEREIEKVRPDWGRSIYGIHTFSSDGAVTIIDAFVRSFRHSFRKGASWPSGLTNERKAGGRP
jgi:hypothetical protein